MNSKIKKDIKHLGIKKLLNKRRQKEKYNERKAKILLIRYKKLKSLPARNELVELCFPIIFSVLKKQSKRITIRSSLLDNEDLFNECIITTIKCIDGYNIINDKKAKFITYLWNALERAVIRFVNNNILKYDNKHTDIEPLMTMGELLEDEELSALNKNKKEMIFIESELLNIEKDFTQLLTKEELKIFILRQKKFKTKVICSALKISLNNYYKVVNNIKKKAEDYLYVKKDKSKKSRKYISKRRSSNTIFKK